MLTKSIVWLGGCLLLAVCLQLAPITFSLGQDRMTNKESEGVYLQPGQLYVVYTLEPVKLPGPIRAASYGTFGTGFFHDGKHKSKDKACCGGIKMLLRDNGYIEYKCVGCGKTWIKSADGNWITDPNEN